jgi:BCD family chlorophyll transporter-like MFS transporter
MRVELGLDLLAVSLMIGGGHYLGALIAIPFGYFSDTHPVFGYRRTFYVLGGALVTVLVLAGSPWVGLWLARSPAAWKVGLAFLYFLLEGISTYVAGTAYLALIADRTTRATRGQATGLIWTLLMVGIIATGVSTSFALREYHFQGLVVLFAVGGTLAMALALAALIGQERRTAMVPRRTQGGFRRALRLVLESRNSRRFGAFLLVSMFSYFMQDVLLEPFGGEVFGLSPAQTTRFNAYMGVGVVTGMLWGGMSLIPRFGKRRITGYGVLILALSFGALTAIALAGQAGSLAPVITLQGLGAGLFTVGGVALMMDMTSEQHTGLFVGAWTLVQALARGPSSLVGGALHNMVSAMGASPGQAYGAVFAFEGLGLLLAFVLLRGVAVERFEQEISSFSTLAAEAMDG